jgi:glucosamine kinase
LMHDAGVELARLARLLMQRFGVDRVSLAGRVPSLHPAIEAALRASLPPASRLATSALDVAASAATAAAQGSVRSDPRL